MSRFFDDLELQLQQAARREIERRARASAPKRRWRRPRVLALLAVGAAGLATPAIARLTGVWDPGVGPGRPARTVATGTDSSGRTCTGNRGPQAPVITSAPPSAQLTSIFGVLREPYTSRDQLPIRHLAALNGATVNPQAIRFLGSASGKTFFAVPITGRVQPPLSTRCLTGLDARRRRDAEASQPRPNNQPRICLLASNGSGGCGGTPNELRQRGAAIDIGTLAIQTIVAGLVPDGVTSVTITYASSRRTFAVHNNFLSYVVDVGPGRAPDAIVWHLANGTLKQVP